MYIQLYIQPYKPFSIDRILHFWYNYYKELFVTIVELNIFLKMQNYNNIEKPSSKPSYSPPDFESEEIFERRALACAKCRTGPYRQHGCMRMPATS
jgi:hypothetical protein